MVFLNSLVIGALKPPFLSKESIVWIWSQSEEKMGTQRSVCRDTKPGRQCPNTATGGQQPGPLGAGRAGRGPHAPAVQGEPETREDAQHTPSVAFPFWVYPVRYDRRTTIWEQIRPLRGWPGAVTRAALERGELICCSLHAFMWPCCILMISRSRFLLQRLDSRTEAIPLGRMRKLFAHLLLCSSRNIFTIDNQIYQIENQTEFHKSLQQVPWF